MNGKRDGWVWEWMEGQMYRKTDRQNSRWENPQKLTDSIKSQFSSKTSRGKRDIQADRHHQRHQQRQPSEQQFPIQVVGHLLVLHLTSIFTYFYIYIYNKKNNK